MQGQRRGVMYVDNKDGNLVGADGRPGRVFFSKPGMGIYYCELLPSAGDDVI